MTRALQRPPQGEGRVIAGVCAALADRFGIDRTLVRVAFVIFGVMGPGIFLYVALWILIPPADR
jgi:phage shock protein C